MAITKKDDRKHFKFGEIKKMQKYKFEFAKRNPRIKFLLDQLEKTEVLPTKKWAQARVRVWAELVKIFHFHPAEIEEFILAMKINDSRAYSFIKTSSINIVFPDRNKEEFYTLPLDYYETKFKDPNSKGYYRPRVIEAINANDGTITVQIKFSQNLNKIRKDITFLQGLLSEELMFQGIKLNEPKPHWNEYENYLKVWDWKEQGWNNMRIAREIYPNDDPWKARKKVKHLHNQAKKMIEKDGFLMI